MGKKQAHKSMDGHLQDFDQFCYLGSIVDKSGGCYTKLKIESLKKVNYSIVGGNECLVQKTFSLPIEISLEPSN